MLAILEGWVGGRVGRVGWWWWWWRGGTRMTMVVVIVVYTWRWQRQHLLDGPPVSLAAEANCVHLGECGGLVYNGRRPLYGSDPPSSLGSARLQRVLGAHEHSRPWYTTKPPALFFK